MRRLNPNQKHLRVSPRLQGSKETGVSDRWIVHTTNDRNSVPHVGSSTRAQRRLRRPLRGLAMLRLSAVTQRAEQRFVGAATRALLSPAFMSPNSCLLVAVCTCGVGSTV